VKAKACNEKTMKIAGGQGRVYQSKRMVIIIIVRDKVAAQGSFRTAKK
jgi:hypothetical protein